MSWSPQQDAALCAIAAWHRNSDDQVFYLAGYAGTGKTTIAKEAASGCEGDAIFAAFTGKPRSSCRARDAAAPARSTR